MKFTNAKGEPCKWYLKSESDPDWNRSGNLVLGWTGNGDDWIADDCYVARAIWKKILGKDEPDDLYFSCELPSSCTEFRKLEPGEPMRIGVTYADGTEDYTEISQEELRKIVEEDK